MDSTKQLEKTLRRGRQTVAHTRPQGEDFVSTGSTLLNLACSGRAFGGFAKGHYYLFIGDSGGGKTLGVLTCFAEAANNTNFDGYQLVYDNVENGALFDFEKFFGAKASARIKPPKVDKDGEPVYSDTVESFYYNLDDVLNAGPCIYVLDSENGLSSESEGDKFKEQKQAYEKGKDAAGSYGDGKAKIHSQNLRRICARLRDTGSILIIVSQTRDNIGFGFEKKTRAGGRALKFYATLEMWAAVEGKVKKTVAGKPRTIGVNTLVQVKKNRFTGKDRTVSIDIYYSVGIDDIGANVDYLVSEGVWSKTKSGIDAKELGFSGSKEDLISQIEAAGLEKKVARLVAQRWKEIEDQCVVQRKKRYE